MVFPVNPLSADVLIAQVEAVSRAINDRNKTKEEARENATFLAAQLPDGFSNTDDDLRLFVLKVIYEKDSTKGEKTHKLNQLIQQIPSFTPPTIWPKWMQGKQLISQANVSEESGSKARAESPEEDKSSSSKFKSLRVMVDEDFFSAATAIAGLGTETINALGYSLASSEPQASMPSASVPPAPQGPPPSAASLGGDAEWEDLGDAELQDVTFNHSWLQNPSAKDPYQ